MVMDNQSIFWEIGILLTKFSYEKTQNFESKLFGLLGMATLLISSFHEGKLNRRSIQKLYTSSHAMTQTQ